MSYNYSQADDPFDERNISSAAPSNNGFDDNPFESSTTTTRVNDSYDNNNPFEDYSSKQASYENQLYAQTQPPPLSTSSSWQGGNMQSQDENSTPEQRMADIKRREEELNRRERQADERERYIRENGRINNWPWFYPFIYHDIKNEIQSETSQEVVNKVYWIWKFLLIVLVVNLVAGVFLLASGQSDGASDMAAAIMYLPVIGSLSFFLWYRPIYNAFMKEKAIYYYLFFLFGGFHIAFCAYMLVGIPSTGGAGIINLLRSFADHSIATGVLCIIATVGWALELASFAWMYRAIWAHKNGQGHNFEQAKMQFSQMSLKAFFTRNS